MLVLTGREMAWEGELPGNLATVAGRLLQRLASEGITRMTNAARPGA